MEVKESQRKHLKQSLVFYSSIKMEDRRGRVQEKETSRWILEICLEQ